ncbi:MAG: right-handed parallel beta-helix repeat-containing protein [Bacteroidetes bacterium]|nr:right-handed parallel beta-helix repeat-containing protein [Bacteroidota bacterium]
MKKSHLLSKVIFLALLICQEQKLLANNQQISTEHQLVGGSTPGVSQGPLGYYYMLLGVRPYMPPDPLLNMLPGDHVTIDNNLILNLDVLLADGFLLPLVIPNGVTLEGNYNISAVPGGSSMITSFNRPRFINSHTCPGGDPYCDGNKRNMFILQLEPGTSSYHTTVKGLKLQGALPDWQDDNDGDIIRSNDLLDHVHLLGGGIYLNHSAQTGHSEFFNITQCEISDFTYAGIWPESGTSEVEISDCYIHHIGGALNADPFSFNPGIGYGIYIKETSEATFHIHNVILDECKESIDWNTANGSITINDCSILNGVHSHAANYIFPHPGNGPADCYFYDRQNSQGPICEAANTPYDVSYCGGSDLYFDHNFIRSDLTIPYPYSNRVGVSAANTIWITPPLIRNILQDASGSASFYYGNLMGGGWAVGVSAQSDPLIPR